MNPLDALRQHVTGAIERGEAVPIVGIPTRRAIMTRHEAKKDVIKRLASCGATYSKLTAKTVSCEDLARGSAIFISVKGCQPINGDWALLHAIAEERGKGYILRFT